MISILDLEEHCCILIFLCIFDNRIVFFCVLSFICFELIADKQTVRT